MSHIPVLLYEVIRFLDPHPGEFIIDGTVDGGGHSAELWKKIGPNGKLLGIDWDGSFLETARENILGGDEANESLILVKGNYADLPDILKENDLGKADGLLLDLGFSSHQLTSGRGFSFREGENEPLYMTYSDDVPPVAAILRELKESELTDIIREYGEERYARQIAFAIKVREKRSPIRTAGELAETIAQAVPKNYERGRIHPATRTFQALRIYANDELGNLKRVLSSLSEIIRPGGRVVVIGFHSLEDRIVKNAFRDMAKQGTLEILTKKPIEATEEEMHVNPRSRSAKVRAAKFL
ncbi:MAG: 16S rRNA (cytosine(1402)-N(4))-methyltransferase RsmH [bacterium]|nr:16S rRNA (cytosine(1402)-N(4))-methyltransferase RsmH [bacterium]